MNPEAPKTMTGGNEFDARLVELMSGLDQFLIQYSRQHKITYKRGTVTFDITAIAGDGTGPQRFFKQSLFNDFSVTPEEGEEAP